MNNLARSFPDFNADVSSANKKVFNLVALWRPFIYIKNNVGPKILPWMTEISTELGADRLPFMS